MNKRDLMDLNKKSNPDEDWGRRLANSAINSNRSWEDTVKYMKEMARLSRVDMELSKKQVIDGRSLDGYLLTDEEKQRFIQTANRSEAIARAFEDAVARVGSQSKNAK